MTSCWKTQLRHPLRLFHCKTCSRDWKHRLLIKRLERSLRKLSLWSSVATEPHPSVLLGSFPTSHHPENLVGEKTWVLSTAGLCMTSCPVAPHLPTDPRIKFNMVVILFLRRPEAQMFLEFCCEWETFF